MNSPTGLIPVSSSNSLLAASSGFSPSAYSPFGIDHAPSSFFFQKGPPGWTRNTCTPASHLLNINSPALDFPTSLLLSGPAHGEQTKSMDPLCSHTRAQGDYRSGRLAGPLLLVLYIPLPRGPHWTWWCSDVTNEPILLPRLASLPLRLQVVGPRCPVRLLSVNSAKKITASLSERFLTKNW